LVTVHPARGGEGTRRIPPARSILVVTDDPVIVGTVGLVFRALGYEIRVASRDEDVLALMREESPGVVLCDAEMRTLDAARLTREIRTVDGGERTIVILTAYGAEPPANAADGFVPRPFDPIKVVDLIETLGPNE
jgi:CheY-like chemotaxis protein